MLNRVSLSLLAAISAELFDNGKQKGFKADPQIKKLNVGRNSLCPCGSTKKFKRCCINKTQTVIT